MEQWSISQMIPPNGDWRAVYWTGVTGKVWVSNRSVALWVMFDASVVRGLVASPDSGLVDAEEDSNFLGYAANLEQVARFGTLARERCLKEFPGGKAMGVKILYLSESSSIEDPIEELSVSDSPTRSSDQGN